MIIFDTETNGFKGSSVLSISAIRVDFNHANQTFSKVAEYDRYYFRSPGEQANFHAIRVNGLSDNVIDKKRSMANYPLHFSDDIPSFKEFCGTSALFVAHNIQFDQHFIPFKLPNTFCTMRTNTGIVNAGWTGKWPKLSEAANHYAINIKEDSLHSSLYDVLVTFEIFKAMHTCDKTRHLVEEFLRKRV